MNAQTGTNAACGTPGYYIGEGVGCVAFSGGGDASNVQSGTGDARCGTYGDLSGGCLAVALLGNATNNQSGSSVQCGDAWGGVQSFASVGCLSVSVLGRALNEQTGSQQYGGASCGVHSNTPAGVGCVSISGAGDATNSQASPVPVCGGGGYGEFLFGSPLGKFFTAPGLGIGCIAVSGAGNASNIQTSTSTPPSGACGFGDSGEGFGIGCLAVSLLGTAVNQPAGSCGVDGYQGTPGGCLAVSGKQ